MGHQSAVVSRAKVARLGVGALLLMLGLFSWAAGPRAQDGEAAPEPQAVETDAPADEVSGGLEALLPSVTDRVVVLDLQGPIGPALARYITQGIEKSQDSRLIVLEMDTPGGLDTSMREIIQSILASDVPVATYVAPSGARAASAGAFILYASHVAAMAPGTAVGAATPVQMGGSEGGEPSGENAPPPPESATAPRTALDAKAQNDAVSLAVELAQMRGRNVEFAENMVREAASIGATEALALGVIEYQIGTLDGLLSAADGMVVTLGEGEATLDTEGASIERLPMTWVQQLLVLITDPNIAFLLMSLGTIGIIAEFYNPGSFFPGIIGAICLILAFYSLSVIPFSSTGLALLIFGLVIMAAEIFVTSGGILAAAGFLSFALGAFFLFDSNVPGLRLDMRLLLATLVILGGTLAFLVLFALGALAKRVTTGPEDLIGKRGHVVTWDGKGGLVFLGGETWHARAKSELTEGQSVVVKGLDGITLLIAPG